MLFARLAQRIANLWQGQALRNKLSLCLVSMTVFPLLLTTIINEHQSEKTLTRHIITHNSETAASMAAELDRMFSEKIRVLQLAAMTAEIKSMNPAIQLPILQAMASQDTEFQLVIAADSSGRQLIRSDGEADSKITYFDREYFNTLNRTGETVLSDVLISRSTGYPAIIIAQPVKRDQQVIGVLIANVELRKIANRLQRATKYDAYAYLVNKEGRILIHPNREMALRQEDVSYLAPVKAVMAQETGTVTYEFNGIKKMAGYSYVPQTGWGLIVQQPLEDAMVDVRNSKQTAIMITLLAAFGAALTGFVMAGMMVKPIMAITRAAGRLASGNLDAVSPVMTQDEIGQLAKAFNTMAAELKARTGALQESEEKYRSVVENISIGIYRETGDAKSFIAYANPALVTMLGYDSLEEMLAVPLPAHFWSREELVLINEEVERTGSVRNIEVRFRRKDGMMIWCTVSADKHYNHSRGTFCIDGVVKDITEQKLAQVQLRQAHDELERKVAERTRELTLLNEELSRISLQDGLTGIANRRYFDDFLLREWQRAKRERKSIALVMLDVDFFKLYNDTYGHVAGDECLKQIAAAMKKTAQRSSDLAARYGGEEFALVLPDTDQAGAVSVCRNLLNQIRQLAIPHELFSINEFVTASLGVAAVVPTDHLTPDLLVIAADQALYQAKQSGRNQMRLADSLSNAQSSAG